MAVTWEAQETFTGKRIIEMPDPDNEGEMVETEHQCGDIMVTFTSDDDTPVVHTRNVNVMFDEKGEYDRVATDNVIDQVANGVEYKIKIGVIS